MNTSEHKNEHQQQPSQCESNLQRLISELTDNGLSQPDDFVIMMTSTTDENNISTPTATTNDKNNPNTITTSVKTLLWEGLTPSSNPHKNQYTPFISILGESSRISLPKLRKATGYSKIRLVDTNLVEEKCGFSVGCVPPIGHVMKMTVYVDKSIVETNLNETDDDDEVLWSGGCGMKDRQLVISYSNILKYARASGVAIVDTFLLTETDSSSSPSSSDNETTNSSTKIASRKRYSLAKELRDASGRRNNHHTVASLISQCGHHFHSLVAIGNDGNYTKNALHLAAWKGDLESISLLIDAGCGEYGTGLDLANTISVGEGNYGKTPIFYAITQCRDDATLLLVKRGANLLIVNNKGQTPCSLAYSHLEEETCELLYEEERRQLENGGRFVNYRKSHSDHKRYGDVDPRFLDEEDENWGEDVKKKLEEWKERNVETKEGDDVLRCVRVTTEAIRLKRDDPNYAMKQRLRTCDKNKKKLDKKETKKEKAKGQKNDGEDIVKMDYLTLDDVLSDKEEPIVLVDSESSLRQFASYVDIFCSSLENNNNNPSSPADDIIQSSWGLDCEWKPHREANAASHPVATLQLSTTKKSFLIDLQTLCRPASTVIVATRCPPSSSPSTPPHLQDEDERTELDPLELILNSTLRRLFSTPSISIIGFGISQDLHKLASSFPHIPSFQVFTSTWDLPPLAARVASSSTLFPSPKDAKKQLTGLNKTCRLLLKKDLDKEEQCSEWHVRPLRREQVAYACLDAAVVLKLFSILMSQLMASETTSETLCQGLRITWKFTILEMVEEESKVKIKKERQREDAEWIVDKGTTRVVGRIRLARQSWSTEDDTEPGPPRRRIPTPVSTNDDADTTASTLSPTNENHHPTTKKDKKKPQTLTLLSTLPLPLSTLPPIASFLSTSKHSCLRQLLSSRLPPHAELYYNRRSGVIPLSNVHCLFVNFWQNGNGGRRRKYENDFLDEGRRMTFSIDPRKADEKGLLDAFKETTTTMKRPALLFVRPAARSEFMFCGDCTCGEWKEIGGQMIRLTLILTEFEQLAGNDVFRHMLERRRDEQRVTTTTDTTTTTTEENDPTTIKKTKARVDGMEADIAHLPLPLTYAGPTRLHGIRLALGPTFLQKFDATTHLQFPTRNSRVVGMANATLVFLDGEQGKYVGKRRICFREKGREVTIFVSGEGRRWGGEGKLLFQNLAKVVTEEGGTAAADDDDEDGNEDDDEYRLVSARKTCLLFLKLSKSEGYYYCGRSRAVDQSSSPSRLTLQLSDYDSIMEREDAMEIYRKLVEEHITAQRRIDATLISGTVEVAIDESSTMNAGDVVTIPSSSLDHTRLPPIGCLANGDNPASCAEGFLTSRDATKSLSSLGCGTKNAVMELSDGTVILFITLRRQLHAGKYVVVNDKNSQSPPLSNNEDEKHQFQKVTFSFREDYWMSCCFRRYVDNLSSSSSSSSLLLFVRPPHGMNYVYCGDNCRLLSHIPMIFGTKRRQVRFILEMEDLDC